MNADRFQVLQDRFRARCRDDHAALATISVRDDAAALDGLERAAHRIAGGAGMFGHPALGGAASRVETLILEGDADAAVLQTALEALVDALAQAGGGSDPR